MNLISDLQELKKQGPQGSHITVHLALQYLGMEQNQTIKESIYPLSQKNKLESKARFKIPAFPGASERLGKTMRTPIRYEGGWLLETIKSLNK
jgi:hypothetical protein